MSLSPKTPFSLENWQRNTSRVFKTEALQRPLSVNTINGIIWGECADIAIDFVGNEQETNRLTIDSLITERPLREIYLKPFEIAVREANPWAVMTSYNLINGVHADLNKHTLKDILRGEWGYEG